MLHTHSRTLRRCFRPFSGTSSGDISTMGSSSLREPGLGELSGNAAGKQLLSTGPKELSKPFLSSPSPLQCPGYAAGHAEPEPRYPRTGAQHSQSGASPSDAGAGRSPGAELAAAAAGRLLTAAILSARGCRRGARLRGLPGEKHRSVSPVFGLVHDLCDWEKYKDRVECRNMPHSHCHAPVELEIPALTHCLHCSWLRLVHFEGLPVPEPEEKSSMLGEDMTPPRSHECLGMNHYPGPSCTHGSVELRRTGGSNTTGNTIGNTTSLL